MCRGHKSHCNAKMGIEGLGEGESGCCYGPLGLSRLGILWPTQAQRDLRSQG